MKIGIVNDLPICVEALKQSIQMDSGLEVLWIAENGQEAVDRCRSQVPDLVLMDLIMPVMDGVEATRIIMSENPCPILIVTSSIEDNAPMVFKAMGEGALDAVNTPLINAGGSNTGRGRQELLRKIKLINSLCREEENLPKLDTKGSLTPQAGITHSIAIGASSGGPQALAVILGELPADFPVPVIIIQHVDKKFVGELAKWLSTLTPLPVKLAKYGEKPQAGNIYLGNTNDHLIINKKCVFEYVREPVEMPYRPSVDVFFNSLAENVGSDVVGVILTGMGSDGAKGLLKLKSIGATTISQDRESSAVYGMPKAAIDLSASTEILPLSRIADRLVGLVEKSEKKRK